MLRLKSMREEAKKLSKDYDKTEDDLKALQSCGQIIGEVLRKLDDDRYIVKASSGPRYVVGCRKKVCIYSCLYVIKLHFIYVSLSSSTCITMYI